ncbi:MAG: hypothetical protein HYS14_08795 [Candidatus Rokubacteria bacterium]|nr:hypothetical protein [Candidatus Rokubacteria bacterium]
MPRYFVSYRKIDEGVAATDKPEWASFSVESESSLEAHAVRERVEKRLDLFGERLYGSGEVLWLGKEPLDEFLMKREQLPLDASIIYGLIEER